MGKRDLRQVQLDSIDILQKFGQPHAIGITFLRGSQELAQQLWQSLQPSTTPFE